MNLSHTFYPFTFLLLYLFTVLLSCLFTFKYRVPAEHYDLGHEIIEQPGYEQGGKVAPDDTPTKQPLEKEKEQHLDKEAEGRRQVEDNETPAKVACATVVDAAFPYPAIRTEEIAEHGELERDDRRNDILPPVRVEYERGTQPQHKRVDARAEEAAHYELCISF